MTFRKCLETMTSQMILIGLALFSAITISAVGTPEFREFGMSSVKTADKK